MKLNTVLGTLVVLSAGMGAAALAEPVAKAPSIAKVGTEVQITGGGFAQGSVVNIRITDPKEVVSMAAAVAARDGSVAYALVPSSAGSWRVQLTAAAGGAKGAEVKLLATP